MNLWQYLDRRADRRHKRGRSFERQWITFGLFGFIGGMLLMARADPTLWKEETFKDLIKLTVTTGLLNMVLAFHFSANKGDEVKSQNTAKAFEAITATAKQGTAEPDFELEPGETAKAKDA